MGKIFFSYRRTDSKTLAERIVERLQYNYPDQVRADDFATQPKESRRAYVHDFLRTYSVLVVMMGPSWIEGRLRAGTRRLDDENDPVRLAIQSALVEHIPIIPVLVRGAQMPSAEVLPEEIRSLADAKPLIFGSDDEFRGGMMRLHRALSERAADQVMRPVSDEQVDTPPLPARRDELNKIANDHKNLKKPPFQGTRILNLGEVRWILGAGSGRLGTEFGERRFQPDLTGANLSYLNLSGAQLWNAKLAGANLSYANLGGASLLGANLAGADLSNATLAGANLSKAVLRSATLQSTDLTECDMREADLSEVNLPGVNLASSNMQGAVLHGAYLKDANLAGINLAEADLAEVDLQEASLKKANLRQAILEDAKLEGADLSGADLAGADLRQAKLERADLSSANLKGTIIEEVGDLENIIMDEKTRFDEINWGGRSATSEGKDRGTKLQAYRKAAQINHELAKMLRSAGLYAEASRYHLAELKYRRDILRTTPHYGAWLFSCALNLISGYGERIGHTIITYLTVISGFAAIYFVGTNFLGLETIHLSLYQAVIQSVVSFHGRGFVASVLQLGDPMAGVTVAESVFGLFIEAIFIATFTRRFFGD